MGTAARVGKIGAGIVLALGMTAPAFAAGTSIVVPDDFDSSLSDTRATGHYEVDGTSLHIWTEGATSNDKVAEYVTTDTPLADVGEPSLEYTSNAGIAPGFQLVVDFDNDGESDGILVGEPIYNGGWWLTDSAAQFVKDGAPSHAGGSGSANHGTLDQWREAFPDANVVAFGFSLGSGVKGDGVINAIEFAGDRYTFSADVVLTGKDDCKKGGWATSTTPEFANQGDCVSYFATAK